MTSRRRAIETPRRRRTRWQRFIIALTFGDDGRSEAQVEGCSPLHEAARLERALYGDVVSPSIRRHLALDETRFGCHRDMTVVTYR